MTLAATQGPVMSLIKEASNVLGLVSQIEKMGGAQFPHAVGIALSLLEGDLELFRLRLPSRWSGEYSNPCTNVAYVQCAPREVSRQGPFAIGVGICNRRMLGHVPQNAQIIRDKQEDEVRLADSISLVAAWKANILSWQDVIRRAEGHNLHELAKTMRANPA